jgi:hypothetical protein
MSTWKIVSWPKRFRFIDLKNKTLDVSRPDRLSSAEIASIVQAAGLQGTLHFRAGNYLLAQRKTSGTEESLRNIAS